MDQIAKNEFYEINVDVQRNRMYLAVIGFWKKPADVPDYVKDITAAGNKLKPGFCIVTDLRQMRPPATSVGPLHVEAQKVLVTAGLARTAEITGDAVLLEMQLKKYAQESSMTKAEFRTAEEAEAWLDAE